VFHDNSIIDLHRLVKERGPLPVPQPCRYLRQAALALAYVHEHGMIHPDVMPSNLLLSSQGHVKLLDLGLARLSQEELTAEITTTGVLLGTPDYMAPEQWDGTPQVDHRADLYALGCTLFFLLAGRAPYDDERYRTAVSKMTGPGT